MKILKFPLFILIFIALVYLALVKITSMQVEAKLKQSVTYINNFIDQYAGAYTTDKIVFEIKDLDTSLFTQKANLVFSQTTSADGIAMSEEIAKLPVTIHIDALKFNVVFEKLKTQEEVENNFREFFKQINYDYDSSKISSELSVNVWPFRASLKNMVEANSTLGASGPKDMYPAKVATTIRLQGEKDMYVNVDARHVISESSYIDHVSTSFGYRVNYLNATVDLEPLSPGSIYVDGLYLPYLDESRRFINYKGDKRIYWIENAQVKNLSLVQDTLKQYQDKFDFSYELTADKIFNISNLEAQGEFLNIPKDILSLNGIDIMELATTTDVGFILDKLTCDVSYIVNEKVSNKYTKEKSNIPHYDSLRLNGNGKANLAGKMFGLLAEFSFRADKEKVIELRQNPMNTQYGVLGFFEMFDVKGKEAVLDFKLDENSMSINGKSLF